MKFNIPNFLKKKLKLILFITLLISNNFNEIFSFSTKSAMGSKFKSKTNSSSNMNMNMGMNSKLSMGMNSKLGMGLKANYKMTMSNLLAKSHNKKMENKASLNSKNNNKNNNSNNSEIGTNSKILYKGWLKYFKFPDDEMQKKPKNFFKNVLYERDSKRKHATGEV